MPIADKLPRQDTTGPEDNIRKISKNPLSGLLRAVETLKNAQGNDKSTAKALRYLGKRLIHHPQDPKDFDHLWEGLISYYDSIPKLVNQQRAAKKICTLALPLNEENFLYFCESFWRKIANVWNNLGSLSLDKYYYFMRCIESTLYTFLEKKKWELRLVERVVDIIERTILNSSSTNPSAPDGLRYHLTRSFLTELSKVANKNACPIGSESLDKLAGQFLNMFEKTQNFYIQKEICKNVISEFPVYDINYFDKEYLKRLRNRICLMLNSELYKTNTKKRTLVLNALKEFDLNVSKKKVDLT